MNKKETFARHVLSGGTVYRKPPCCDALFIEINNKIECNYISRFFPNIA